MNDEYIMKRLKLLFPLPLLLGFLGYLQCYPNDISGGLYHSLRLYLLQYQIEEVNVLLDIARWTAPVVTLACLFSGIQSVYEWIVCHWRKAFYPSKTIAIYGDNERTSTLVASLGTELKAVEGNAMQPFHKSAKRHVIMFENDEENLRFFKRHLDEFEKGEQVYLHLENFSPNLLSIKKFDLHPFSLAQHTAFQCVLEKSERWCVKAFQQDEVHIAIIGSGKYAEQLLDFCGKLNVFNLKQRIVYHVFGDFQRYISLHYRMKQTTTKEHTVMYLEPNDSIKFYHDSWEHHIELLTTMDDIILTYDKDMENLNIVAGIMQYIPQEAVENCVSLRLESETLFHHAALKEHSFHVFGVNRQICSANSILEDSVLSSAKEQMSEYMALNKRTKEEDGKWNERSYHERQSNIYSAYFRATTLPKVPPLLRMKNIPMEEQIEFMAELEHIRWNRFHFLSNWLYDENVEKEDRAMFRLHNCLKEYKDLDIDLKYYDQKEAIKVLKEYYSKRIKIQNKKLDKLTQEESDALRKKQDKAKKELKKLTLSFKEVTELSAELENGYRLRKGLPTVSEELTEESKKQEDTLNKTTNEKKKSKEKSKEKSKKK